MTTSSRSTSCRRRKKPQVAKLKRPAEGRRRALSGDGRRPRRRSDQLAPAARCSSPRCRSTGWCFTKSPKRRFTKRWSTRATSTTAWCGPRKRGGFSTGCTATKSRRCCGGRFGPRLSAGRVQSVAVRLIVERERQRMAFRLGHLVGPARPRSPRATARSSRPSWSRVGGRKIPAGKDFDPATGKIKDPQLAAARRAAGAANWPSGCRRRQFRVGSARRQALHAQAARRRSRPARCSKRPTASSASPPGGR